MYSGGCEEKGVILTVVNPKQKKWLKAVSLIVQVRGRRGHCYNDRQTPSGPRIKIEIRPPMTPFIRRLSERSAVLFSVGRSVDKNWR